MSGEQDRDALAAAFFSSEWGAVDKWLADHDRRVRANALREASTRLREFANERFDGHGPYDARGAALWDAAAHVDEEMR